MGTEGTSNFGLDILDQHLPWRVALENVQDTQEFVLDISYPLIIEKFYCIWNIILGFRKRLI